MNWINIGLAFAGVSCGYLIGASNTPVVGAALPILGAVIMAGMAIYQHKSLNDGLSAVKDLHESVQLEVSKELFSRESFSSQAIGIGLIFFFVPFILGLFGGSYVRNYKWFLPKRTPFYPVWKETEREPKTLHEALEWMRLYQLLKEGGMESKDAIYALNLPDTPPNDRLFIAPAWERASRKPESADEALEWIKLQQLLTDSGLKETDIVKILELPRRPAAASTSLPSLSVGSPVLSSTASGVGGKTIETPGKGKGENATKDESDKLNEALEKFRRDHDGVSIMGTN